MQWEQPQEAGRSIEGKDVLTLKDAHEGEGSVDDSCSASGDEFQLSEEWQNRLTRTVQRMKKRRKI